MSCNSNKAEKNARNVNFSSKEEELLVKFVTKNLHFRENKKTDAVMRKQKDISDNFAKIDDNDGDSCIVTGKKKSCTAEARNLLTLKDQLMALKKNILQKEIELNEIKKKYVTLKQEKCKLKIDILEKICKCSK